MPVRQLPSSPNLEHLKHQAKDLLREHAARRPDAAQRIREFHPDFHRASDEQIFAARLLLSGAQLTLAREAGFASWTRLKRHIERPTLSDRLHLPHHERIEDRQFRRAVDLLDGGDVPRLRELLRSNPELVHQQVFFEGGNYFRSPSLLEFVAENPVRHGKLPANILHVTRLILESGPDSRAKNEALMLVATGSVARQCGLQVPLIDLLCSYGAEPAAAIHAAAVLGEHESVRALLRNGAGVDLPVAAALGLLPRFKELLPSADAEHRHLALAVAVQFGHREIVRALLEAGEDPNRYNPLGGHSHGTPLHHAAGAGNQALVHLLLEHGARPDLKDVLWRGTPADWAAHGGHRQVEQYLRALG